MSDSYLSASPIASPLRSRRCRGPRPGRGLHGEDLLCIVRRHSTGEETMALQLGDTAPDFDPVTTEGRIRFHDWLGDSWGILFSHPRDFTPVCTTELGAIAR